jgi:ankyrin repeat protein
LLCYRPAFKSGFGDKSVKTLRFVIVVASLLSLSAPAAAQLTLAASYDFAKAVAEKNGNKATELLEKNPPGIVNGRDNDGNTALIIAILRQDPDWTSFLIGKGADLDLQAKGGDTPLIAAARVGFDEAVDWLIGAGAKVDGDNRAGETPLIVAVQQRNLRMVRLLLSAGADPDRSDSAQGFSARQYAQRDPRARQILEAIDARSPKTASKP